PAVSTACAVALRFPSASACAGAGWKDQSPAALAVTLPSCVLSMKTRTLAFASAVPLMTGRVLLVRLASAGGRVAGAAGGVPATGALQSGAEGAVVSTLQMWVAGVASTLPAASRARTSKRCWPGERPVKVAGVVHATKPALSRLQSKEGWLPPSTAANTKV